MLRLSSIKCLNIAFSEMCQFLENHLLEFHIRNSPIRNLARKCFRKKVTGVLKKIEF